MKDEQNTCDSLEKVRAELKLNKGNFLLIDGLIYHRDKILNEPVMQLVLPRCRIDKTCKGCQLRKPEKIGDSVKNNFNSKILRAASTRCSALEEEIQSRASQLK
ncbi:hypothetical protein TNCV_4669821 [Trichonephila clavipes]|nr:hypothetical protein TNCV_4669821 [Trichonephila clavipes]